MSTMWHEANFPPAAVEGEDDIDILLGEWYEDDGSNPYQYPSRWLWIALGRYEDGAYLNQNGEEVIPTHWQLAPQSPIISYDS